MLRVRNFKAVEAFEVSDLTDFVLIAGPNGCGKSCILDAIRLLKSVYGGYQENEWMQWFGEFQINLSDRAQLLRLFRDQAQRVEIEAAVQLSRPEKTYLDSNAEAVLEPLAWSAITGRRVDRWSFPATAIATEFRQHAARVAEIVDEQATALRASLEASDYLLSLYINPNGSIVPTSNPTIEVVFQTYDPDHLGLVDYHSASRTYQRENIGGVNLDVRNLESQRMQQTLYNAQGKYGNVKTELATTYIQDLVAREAGVNTDEADLNATLKELFQTFFPEKEYLGVQPAPDGGLTFPVRVSTGQMHDINELSSGEKEVLYGYLRLRNTTPTNSTILLDEPELHLNPALLQGFPDFYHRHLGRARGNQLWLVTHSDTLLRQAVGNPNYSVFHMTMAAGSASPVNQALPVIADDDLERATIDLVGDLATYRPKSKVVLFEGGGDTEFDVLVTQRLFPSFAKTVNLLSGGGKRRVRELYEVLARTAEQVGMADRFFAITDRDSEPWDVPPPGAHRLTWDVYHIENYLLVPQYVRAATEVILGRDAFADDGDVLDALRSAAVTLLPTLTVERLRAEVNSRVVSSINLGAPPNPANAAAALMPSIVGSFGRLDAARSEVTDAKWLEAKADELHATFQVALDDGTWITTLPGRPILKRFVAHELAGAAPYEAFRNVVLDQMVDDAYEPPGMKRVLDFVAGVGSPSTAATDGDAASPSVS